MMTDKIDPQLLMLMDATTDNDVALTELAESGFFGLEMADDAPRSRSRTRAAAGPMAQVLVEASVERETLEKAGMVVQSAIGDIFTGTVSLDAIEKISKLDGVTRIESAREMVDELDLAVVDTRVNLVHAGPPGRRGSGVIVGIVDSGIDYTHPAFRNPDGTSRILFIWDQRLTAVAGEAPPPGFTFGVQYTNAQINAALATANPFATVRHQVGFGDHGTHVAGIAAGNGRGSSPTQPEFTFVGVAPEADIIVVAVGGSGPEGMATSTNALDGVNYVYQRANALGRPAAVNMSLGDNLGPHDGTSLLERGLDNLLGTAGRAFVKSAGNVGSARHHAGGTVATGATVDIGFAQPAGNTTPDHLDFWYPGGSTFRAEMVDSAGNGTGFVNVGTATTFTLPGGNTVRIDHRNNDPVNGDKRVFITITRGTATQIRPGNWSLRLRSVSSAGGGRFDGWIQRHNSLNQRPTFNAPFESNDRTISTPGTAREVITVANYSVRNPGAGTLTASSSRGPTRDNRAAPTIAAPGTNIFSAAGAFGTGNPYIAQTGTSMSAPHITGVIALMFQKNPNRTQAQIIECLTSTARMDGFTGPVPNTGWGAGKVDAQAAVNCVPAVLGPFVTKVRCPQASVVIRCLPRTVINCPPQLTRVICPAPTTIGCPPPLTTVGCPPATTVGCPVPTTIGCPIPTTVACPIPTTLGCPLPTLVNCPVQTTLGCPPQQTSLRCPSVVDGCPSTPGGCDPFTVVINPGLTVVNPGPFNPGTFNPGTFDPRLTPGGLPIQSDADLPEGGYWEYDDGWFDEGGSEED
ncbi:MAG: hypothetical protein C0471_11295 [Erythrobacter sp.]|nr:hypothetical protein [Erythrobacter sp.]